jgi:hypothetical protein
MQNPLTQNITVFWDVTPCSTVQVYWRFGGTYCLHLQRRRVSQPSKQTAATCLFGLLADPQTEAVRFSEMLTKFYQTGRRNITEDRLFIIIPLRTAYRTFFEWHLIICSVKPTAVRARRRLVRIFFMLELLHKILTALPPCPRDQICHWQMTLAVSIVIPLPIFLLFNA